MFGGAAGLAIGAVTHGHGWLAVVALIAVAGVSGLLSARGDIGSVTGLQLLVYTSLGAGPIGALRPVWHTAAGFLVGVVWALILILPGWLHAPYGREQRDVAAVYDALAALLRSVGGDEFTARRQALTGAVLLALVHGAWLLIPFAVLAALLPFGRSRNYGLLATFLTPLVVVLIDTLIGCAIVLLIGFAPWPMSWYSHLPRQYARAALDVCRYLEEALGPGRGCGGPPTGPWPTCGPSSSAPCPSLRRSAGARPPGGPRWSRRSR
ncbi:MAG TPA: FUSC family membrane protein [Streptosporangiaceae bacterium]|nr:FUSC family membrane protein [Streptosporangiaceae bacterium]